MHNETYQIEPSLSLLFSTLNKEYFYFKQSLQSKGEDLFKHNLNLVFELIDKQHLLLQAFEQDHRTLLNELSFRRLIIERKSSILRELNSVVLNKFIDRNYKQEILINQLKAEIDELKIVHKLLDNNKPFNQLTLVENVSNFNNDDKPKAKQINVYQCYKEKSKYINKKKDPLTMNFRSSTGGYPTMHTSVNVTSSQTLINLYKCYLNTPKAKLTKMRTSKYLSVKKGDTLNNTTSQHHHHHHHQHSISNSKSNLINNTHNNNA